MTSRPRIRIPSSPRLGLQHCATFLPDSLDESVGSPPSRVILFGDISTVILSTSMVAPETSTIASVISYAAPVMLWFLTEYIFTHYPAISSFLCIDSSEAPDSFDGPPSQDPYVATVAHWRSRVIAHPSSLSKFPIAPLLPRPGFELTTVKILYRPGRTIPFGRPYGTHLNGPRKLLTARKRVGPLPAHRLASRHASPRSLDHHPSSSSSSSDSSPVYSSGLDAPDQAHSGSSTRDIPPRLCYPPRRAPQCSKAFHHWCAAPLSTLYPPTTSESSLGDSSEKRNCIHLNICYSVHIARDVDPWFDSFTIIYADYWLIKLIPIDPTDVRDDTDEYEADTSAGDTVEVGIDPMSAPIVEEEIVEPAGEDSSNSFGTRDGIVRSFEDMPIELNDDVRDFYHHMSEVRIDRIVKIETVQRQLEAD
ncbi:hypothetical protein Tco_1202616 [Tanacetum coccineum]